MPGFTPIQILALLAVLAVAAALRLYQLDTLPAGLHIDEAAYGMQAARIVAGARPIFFSDYSGREALFQYLIAGMISLNGQTILAIRLPAALSGIALVLFIALCGQRVLGCNGALLAAAAAAGANWLIHINRIGFRANLVPLMLALWAWLLLCALANNRRRDWLGAGAVLGLAAYTYLSIRFAPILVALFLGYLLIWQRHLWQRCWPGVLLMLGVATTLALPLIIHFLRVPGDWSVRYATIWVCSNLETGPCLQRIAGQLWATVLMVGVAGDPLRFFNIPGSPALAAPFGVLFYVGLLLALRRWREPACALLLIWWAVMLLPGVLSQDSPHFLRTLGAAPPTMLLWALPLTTLGQLLRQHAPRGMILLPAAGVLLVLLMAGISTRDYFTRWATRPELYYDYMGYAVDAAHAASQIPADTTLYISEEYYQHASYRYLSPRSAQAHWFDARSAWPLTSAEQRRVYIISATTALDERIRTMLSGVTVRDGLNAQGQYAYTLLDAAASVPAATPPDRPFTAQIGSLELQGYQLSSDPPCTTLQVTLWWQVQARNNRPLRLFVHLIDATGRLVTQNDSLGYPSNEWQPWDRFVTLHSLALPAELAPGSYELLLGLYDTESGQREPVAPQPFSNRALLLARIDTSPQPGAVPCYRFTPAP